VRYDRFMRFLRRYGWAFALYTAICALDFSYRYLDDLAREHTGTLVRRLLEETTGAYTALALLPFIVWFARRFSWPMQIVGALAYTAAHTTLMAATRAVLFPALGQGHYDYGIMSYRYPMEASGDIVSYAVIVGFVYFLDRTRKARDAELKAATLQRELAETKLANLRLQLHPHFLFNTLNAVSSVMYEDVRKADAMLARLSEFLRVILTTSDVQEITLDEELQIERMYVDIMKARLENNLQLSLNVDPDARLARVPALLLQPIIENSIRHGMDPQRNQLALAINATREESMVTIRIRDDGVGLLDATPTYGHGLSNVRSRLEHLYGPDSSVRVAQLSPRGTEVCLQFPFRS
jgi:two-component system LytT family sensor kinase